MSSKPERCRTCNSHDKEIGNYCADCTTNFVRSRVGWDKVKWWSGQYSGDDSASTRQDKQKLFNALVLGYSLGWSSEPTAEQTLREGIRWVIEQSPPSRENSDRVNEKIDAVVKLLKGRLRAVKTNDGGVGTGNQ